MSARGTGVRSVNRCAGAWAPYYPVARRAGPTYLGVIRTVESLGEISGLRKWHTAEAADDTASGDTLLARENTDLETRVLRSLEHLVPVKAVERLSRVLARNGAVDEDRPSAGMQVGEAG
jgi:hypothetical protein